ncbi:MAG TPA: M48 family peptidase, partial [Flavobacteriia bacterium]|nr:M48 family peptidase [Flavobacteriia bacterium]
MRRRGGLKLRLLLFAGIALFSLFKYFANSETNPYTGKKQHISITPSDEIQMGLSSVPQMAR